MKMDANVVGERGRLFWPAEFPSELQKQLQMGQVGIMLGLSQFLFGCLTLILKPPGRSNNCIYSVWTDKCINICKGLLCACYKCTYASQWHYSWKQFPSVFLFTLLNVNVESSENANKIWMMNIPHSLVSRMAQVTSNIKPQIFPRSNSRNFITWIICNQTRQSREDCTLGYNPESLPSHPKNFSPAVSTCLYLQITCQDRSFAFLNIPLLMNKLPNHWKLLKYCMSFYLNIHLCSRLLE